MRKSIESNIQPVPAAMRTRRSAVVSERSHDRPATGAAGGARVVAPAAGVGVAAVDSVMGGQVGERCGEGPHGVLHPTRFDECPTATTAVAWTRRDDCSIGSVDQRPAPGTWTP